MRIMSNERRTALLFSGGKDSNYAFYVLSKEGYEVCCLISVIAEDNESMLLHTINSYMTILQSEALGIPLLLGVAKKNQEIETLGALIERAAKAFKARYLATGGIASVYQKKRFEKIALNKGLKPLAPLWGINQEEYLFEIVKTGIKALITRVAAFGLGKELLGAEINQELASKIVQLSRKYMFNPSFEGGEAETLVVDAPFYRRRLQIISASKKWFGDWGELQIYRAALVEKT